MTKDEVIAMTLRAGWSGIYSEWVSETEVKRLAVPANIEQVEKFAELVAAHEREACALRFEAEAETWALLGNLTGSVRRKGAAVIRATTPKDDNP